MTNILKATQLTKTFGNVKALDHCDLEIRKGEIFGYLGPSGAGKTTTIKLLTGQLHSDSGQITVLGEDPFSPDIRQRIGIMSDMSGLYEKMTVYENLDIFADIYGIRDKKDTIRKTLMAVDLLDSAKKKVEKLSRGMKQRLVFARTILHSPDLLFLDEPTANLDPATADEIRELIRDLNRSGATIFLTTHNMEEADELCHRIALLNKGHIVESGSPEELKLKYAGKKVVITTGKKRTEVPLEKNCIIKALEQAEDLLMIHSEEPSLRDVFLTLTKEEA
ncbi:MAG TPA: ABC transporter ATP-binding protein [Candidatus Mediterraneibacter tabaqchaliae]|uniref:ABC transporter ATP-binding protein n=1 Tax=Candidatus Mediterraneibacter tabaqchaliae TaxID=2838689 RepID=A0A9D2U0Y3_9FIRM|nr:ABC transporter ATP-binding protein [Candidatus Mediterraneibacter tabaqchaliae]